jgi:hypothetical protein
VTFSVKTPVRLAGSLRQITIYVTPRKEVIASLESGIVKKCLSRREGKVLGRRKLGKVVVAIVAGTEIVAAVTGVPEVGVVGMEVKARMVAVRWKRPRADRETRVRCAGINVLLVG